MTVPNRKITDKQLIEAYAELKSIYKVAAQYGMCFQSIQERLIRLNIPRNTNHFSEQDKQILRDEYKNYSSLGNLNLLAIRLNRTKNFLCRQAKYLGLTDRRIKRPYSKEGIGIRMKEMHAKNGHPRGMLGKKHSADALKKMSKASTKNYKLMSERAKSDRSMRMLKTKVVNGNYTVPSREGASWKVGWREFGGKKYYYRSRWEANYGRYLEFLKSKGQIKEWEHEPEVFWFEKIMRGCRSYLPDFRVTENNGSIVYHEVKGWMDSKSKTKINRMRIYHPKVKLIVIDSKAYRALSSQVNTLVPDWE